MKRTLEGSPAPANTRKVPHDEPASGADALAATNASGVPTVYNRSADLVEELKRQTNALTVKNDSFLKEAFTETSIIRTPASGQLLIPYSSYQSPIADCFETPLEDLKELISRLPELNNLVLADYQGLSKEDIDELIAWAATERPKLRIQTY